MRPIRLLLLAAAPFLLGPSCVSNETYEVSFGDYLLRFRPLTSQPASPEGRFYDLSATLEQVAAPALPGPAEVTVTTADPRSEVVAGQLIFPTPGPLPVATGSAFRVRQRGVFDPSVLDFRIVVARAPALAASDPAPGAIVAPSAWPTLEFAAVLPPAALGDFTLRCGVPIPISLHELTPERLVVNPQGELPAGSSCQLRWSGPSDVASLAFRTAGAGAPATVVYDRSDDGLFPPFPDDTLQISDPTTLTGRRNAVPIPQSRAPDVVNLAAGLLTETNRLDGWSPDAGLVVLLSEAPETSSLPRTPAESLDPLASIGLFDLDPQSPRYGQRHPFALSVRADRLPDDATPTHQLVLFPSRPLEPGGRYALVVTRRALASGLRPFGSDAYYRSALGPPQPDEPPLLPVTRRRLQEVLPALSEAVSPPIPSDDIALALSISVRSIDTLPDDVLAMRRQLEAQPAPSFVIDSIAPGDGATAAILRGRWDAPTWLSGPFLLRDTTGAPLQNGTRETPFVMTLPDAALSGPVPITFYQHGSPGSSDEVVAAGERLSGPGFAVIGFTDVLNDRFVDTNQQLRAIFGTIVLNRKLSDFYLETYGNQLAFLRLIESLGTLDVLPLGAPDGVPDLDPTLPLTYEGISFGAVHGAALMPYAPEIRAAALVAGGGGFAERLMLQDATDPLGSGSFLFSALPSAVPSVRVSDIWVALQYFQTSFDEQEPALHALFTYGPRRFPVSGTLRKPSILIVEGIDDSFSPANATRAEAHATGPIPQLPPIAVPATVLQQVTTPVNLANVDFETTAGLVQYVPSGVPGIPPSPGCAGIWLEGHFCAQAAAEAVNQRIAFYRTAVDDGVPTILDPAFDGDGDGRPDAQEIADGTDPTVAE